ncbi:MAG TPA: hypothetical protein PK098_10790 [Phycisphaerales bacterium]|nr:hypothetical protein [Phycisphaerales bacterium]
MASHTQRATHEQWLLEITGIPTAAGREQRVVQWVQRWVEARKNLTLKHDPVGNLIISVRSTARSERKPLYITAHLDHPAFVVRRLIDANTVELEFRGGVHDPYFKRAAIDIIDSQEAPHRAVIKQLDANAKPFKRVQARLNSPATGIRVGDIARWAFSGRGGRPVIDKGILHAPACDDLAAVAAALSTLDVLRRRRGLEHVAVLLTVAEEVGFIGAIGACRAKSIPKSARLICLENSRSYAESPIGAGPILRVGDKTSVFAPDLTNQINAVMNEHQRKNPSFKWQRRLMPGGTCEATTFSAYGYQSTCICLPLGNYHNMADIDGVLAGKKTAKVGPEFISVSDYHGMIDMLITCAEHLDSTKAPSLRDRMEDIFAKFGHVIQ